MLFGATLLCSHGPPSVPGAERALIEAVLRLSSLLQGSTGTSGSTVPLYTHYTTNQTSCQEHHYHHLVLRHRAVAKSS
jgi:hypothetical protein